MLAVPTANCANSHPPRMIMVFPINFFLFGSIFYLVYKLITDEDEASASTDSDGGSTAAAAEGGGGGDDGHVSAEDVVANVRNRIPGLNWLLLAMAIVGLGERKTNQIRRSIHKAAPSLYRFYPSVLNWYFWSLIWSLYIRMGKGCSLVHRLATPPRGRRRRRPRPPPTTTSDDGTPGQGQFLGKCQKTFLLELGERKLHFLYQNRAFMENFFVLSPTGDHSNDGDLQGEGNP